MSCTSVPRTREADLRKHREMGFSQEEAHVWHDMIDGPGLRTSTSASGSIAL